MVKETINLKFDGVSLIDRRLSNLENDFAYQQISKPSEKKEDVSPFVDAIRGSNENKATNKDALVEEGPYVLPHSRQTIQNKQIYVSSHPNEQILGKSNDGVKSRPFFRNKDKMAMVSQIKCKNIEEALSNEEWILTWRKSLINLPENDIWMLVPPPSYQSVIDTRQIFKNKLDEKHKVVRIKVRLVAQGYNQQEGIDIIETFALVVYLKAIRKLLAFVA